MDDVIATYYAHVFVGAPLVTFFEDLVHLKPQDASVMKSENLDSEHQRNGVDGSSFPRASAKTKRIYATAFAEFSQNKQAGPSVNGADNSPPPTAPESTEYFDKVSGSSWPHVRFKPPPSAHAAAGWRVEFRVMEAQVTDFENAAFAVWTMLLARAILHYDLNLYLPIARVAEGIERAHAVDAVRGTTLHFRKDLAGHPPAADVVSGAVEDEYELKSVDEIVNGSRDGAFPGLASFVRRYAEERYVDADPKECRRLEAYFELVEGRASGRVETLARWMRRFIREHDDYQMDSVVTERIGWDLMVRLKEITEGRATAGFCRIDAQSRHSTSTG